MWWLEVEIIKSLLREPDFKKGLGFNRSNALLVVMGPLAEADKQSPYPEKESK